MRFLLLTFVFLVAGALQGASDHLAAVRSDLQNLAIDRSQTWRVRDLELSQGGVKVYFSEGVLAFATPVGGQRIAAVFTTEEVEAGDGEIIAFPPIPAERASLARFANTPNLDEHFSSALFFFADGTAQELLKQIHAHPLHPAPDLATTIGAAFDESLRRSASEIDVRIAQSILDRHRPSSGFFYGMLAGRTLGTFDFVFQPDQPDSVVLGRINANASQRPSFQIWCAYRPRNVPEPVPAYHLSDYRIDTTIRPDLSMTSIADFDYKADADDGAVISLLLTPRMRVTAATIDGHPASVLMHDSPRTTDIRGTVIFLLVNETEMSPGSHHHVTVRYEGSVIRRTADGSYFVDDRNVWYPFMAPMLSAFDLTFHLPANLRLVSTGDLVTEDISNGERMVHRKTSQVQALAGFNIGEFTLTTSERSPYRIEVCSNAQVHPAPDLGEQAGRILQFFTSAWMPLSSHSLAITPIEGYFGQGFPGLIYLSNVSYLQERDRPQQLRNPTLDAFFSQLLLPHELAHQWWGNIVTPGDYRSNWIVEAMSNYAALQYLEQADGKAASEAILATYRADLTRARSGGELVDSYGPLTFDQRLLSNFGPGVWHDILYEKGTWIFHLLRQRLGDAAFHDFQLRVIKDFATRPIANEDLREEAARFVPTNQPDRNLTAFFDTWVYDTGIPSLAVSGGNLKVSNVPGTYSLEVPLRCGSSSVVWLRATEGETPLPRRNCSLPRASEFLFRE